jgi:pilus assembly protein CpaB
MVVAIVCGLGASYLTSRAFSPKTDQPVEEKVSVLVAKQDIPINTLIKDPNALFVLKEFAKGQEPKKAIQDPDKIKDRKLNKSLSEEQFVTAEDLIDPNQSSLDTRVPKGMRAIGLKVSPDSIAGGFVLPFSRVDVVSTVKTGERSYSQIILQNMLVLAADTKIDPEEGKQSMIATTITLAARPEEAQKLRLAGSLGELSLILRRHDDEEIVSTKSVGMREMNTPSSGSVASAGAGGTSGPVIGDIPDVPKPASPPQVKKPDKKPEPPKPPKVRTLRGTIQSLVEFE